MVGSIGSLTVLSIKNGLEISGYGVVVITVCYGIFVSTIEIKESVQESSKSLRYMEVNLGIRKLTKQQIRDEKKTQHLVDFVRETIQAMLEGEVASSSMRTMQACPFPDEQIGQMLNNADLYYTMKQMRRNMFRSFVLNETKNFFRRIMNQSDVKKALEQAGASIEDKSAKIASSEKVNTRGSMVTSTAAITAVFQTEAEKEKEEMAQDKEDFSNGLISEEEFNLRKKERAKKRKRRAGGRSIRTVLFRLTDKISKFITHHVVTPPPHLVATGRADIWLTKHGASKISLETWTRVLNEFWRRLESFPKAVKVALHCDNIDKFNSHYIQPWNVLIGPLCEQNLESWFTARGGVHRNVKAKMLDCLFDLSQHMSNVETMQRLRNLLVTEPSQHHSHMVGMVYTPIPLSERLDYAGKGLVIEDILTTKPGEIVEVKVELNNVYTEKTDPKLGSDGWAVRLLRDVEARNALLTGSSTSTARPVALGEGRLSRSLGATINRASAKHATLFNMMAEGWVCNPNEASPSEPCLQVDLGKITRVAAISLQGGSPYAIKKTETPMPTFPTEAIVAIDKAATAFETLLSVTKNAISKANAAMGKKFKVLDDETENWIENANNVEGFRASRRGSSYMRAADELKKQAETKKNFVSGAEQQEPQGYELSDAMSQAARECLAVRAAVAFVREGDKDNQAIKALEDMLEEHLEANPNDLIGQGRNVGVESAKASAKVTRKMPNRKSSWKVVAGKLNKNNIDDVLPSPSSEKKNNKKKDVPKRMASYKDGESDTEIGLYLPFALGLVYMHKGRYEDAETQFSECLKRLRWQTDQRLRRFPELNAGGVKGAKALLKESSSYAATLSRIAHVPSSSKRHNLHHDEDSKGQSLDDNGEEEKKTNTFDDIENDDVEIDESLLTGDPMLWSDPARGLRDNQLLAACTLQWAEASWHVYKVRTGLPSLRMEDLKSLKLSELYNRAKNAQDPFLKHRIVKQILNIKTPEVYVDDFDFDFLNSGGGSRGNSLQRTSSANRGNSLQRSNSNSRGISLQRTSSLDRDQKSGSFSFSPKNIPSRPRLGKLMPTIGNENDGKDIDSGGGDGGGIELQRKKSFSLLDTFIQDTINSNLNGESKEVVEEDLSHLIGLGIAEELSLRLSIIAELSALQRHDAEEVVTRFRSAVALNPLAFGAQTGLAIASEEVRRLFKLEEDTHDVDPLHGAEAIASLGRMQYRGAKKNDANGDTLSNSNKSNDNNSNNNDNKEGETKSSRDLSILAAGPQDDTLSIAPAFMNPAWVTRYTVEFSRDKINWHVTDKVDGVRDPEMVTRVYLPPPQPGQNGMNDPFEARYIRIKPVTKPTPEWHRQISMRIGIEEVQIKHVNEVVTFSSGKDRWDPKHPEEFSVNFLRKGLGFRIQPDPLGISEGAPVVGVVSVGKLFPRRGDLVVTVDGVPLRGMPIKEVTSRILNGKRPTLLKFLPREIWSQRVAKECFDLVYNMEETGLFVGVHAKSGLPVITEKSKFPLHVNPTIDDASRPDVGDQVFALKRPGRSDFEVLMNMDDPYQHLYNVVSDSSNRPLVLRFFPGKLGRKPRTSVMDSPSKMKSTIDDDSATQEDDDKKNDIEDDVKDEESGKNNNNGRITQRKMLKADRFTVSYGVQKLGLELSCGRNPNDLPYVKANNGPKLHNPNLRRPEPGDVIEEIGGLRLLSHPDAYAKSLELITRLPRPLLIGFVSTPKIFNVIITAPYKGFGVDVRSTNENLLVDGLTISCLKPNTSSANRFLEQDENDEEDEENKKVVNNSYPSIEAVETGKEYSHLSFSSVGDTVVAVNGNPLNPLPIDKATAEVEGLSPFYVAFVSAINKIIAEHNKAHQQSKHGSEEVSQFDKKDEDNVDELEGGHSNRDSAGSLLRNAKSEMLKVDSILDGLDDDDDREPIKIKLTIKSCLTRNDTIKMLQNEEEELKQLLMSNVELTPEQAERIRIITDDPNFQATKLETTLDSAQLAVNLERIVAAGDDLDGTNNDLTKAGAIAKSGGGDALKQWARRKRQMELDAEHAEQAAARMKAKAQAEASLKAIQKEVLMRNIQAPTAAAAEEEDDMPNTITTTQSSTISMQSTKKQAQEKKEEDEANANDFTASRLPTSSTVVSHNPGGKTDGETVLSGPAAVLGDLTSRMSMSFFGAPAVDIDDQSADEEEGGQREYKQDDDDEGVYVNVDEKKKKKLRKKKKSSKKKQQFQDDEGIVEEVDRVEYVQEDEGGSQLKQTLNRSRQQASLRARRNSTTKTSSLSSSLSPTRSNFKHLKNMISNNKKLGTSLDPSAPEFVIGGAPYSGGISDIEHEIKDALFTQPKLGIDLVDGESLGHLPVLGLPTIASGNKMVLEAGDQLVAIGSYSLIGEPEPFKKAVELIQSTTKRPLLLQFQSSSTPGPYAVTFKDQLLGIQIEPKKGGGGRGGTPVVWDTSKCTKKYPMVGDSLISVGGVMLSHPTDKLAEAISLLSQTPRPVICLFQPAEEDRSLLLPPPPPPPPGAAAEEEEEEEDEDDDDDDDDGIGDTRPSTLTFFDSVIPKTQEELDAEAAASRAHEKKMSLLFAVGAHVRLVKPCENYGGSLGSGGDGGGDDDESGSTSSTVDVPLGSVGVVLKRLTEDDLFEEGGDSGDENDMFSSFDNGEDRDGAWSSSSSSSSSSSTGAKSPPSKKRSIKRKASFDILTSTKKVEKPKLTLNENEAVALVMFPQATIMLKSIHVESQPRNYSTASRAYTVTFTEEKLGLTLAEPDHDNDTTWSATNTDVDVDGVVDNSSNSLLPVVESVSDMNFDNPKAVFPSSKNVSYVQSKVTSNVLKLVSGWQCPSPGHRISAVGGMPVIVRGRDPYDVALSLIEASSRPLTIDFLPPQAYTLTFPKLPPNTHQDNKKNKNIPGGLVTLKANHHRNKKGSYVDVNREILKRKKPLRTTSFSGMVAVATGGEVADTMYEKGLGCLAEFGLAISDGLNDPSIKNYLHEGDDGIGGAVLRRSGCNLTPLIPAAFDRVIKVNKTRIDPTLTANEAAKELISLLASTKARRPLILSFAAPPPKRGALDKYMTKVSSQQMLKKQQSVRKSRIIPEDSYDDGSCGICLKLPPKKPRKVEACGHSHCKACLKDITSRGVRIEKACPLCHRGYEPIDDHHLTTENVKNHHEEESRQDLDDVRDMYEASCRLIIPVLRRLHLSEYDDKIRKILSWDKIPAGLKRDLDTGLELLDAAASHGHARAQYDLGCYYFDGLDGNSIEGKAHKNQVFLVNKSTGIEWLKKAGKKRHGVLNTQEANDRYQQYHGIGDAATRVALAYWNGNGINKSMTSASEWYAYAAELTKEAKQRGDVEIISDKNTRRRSSGANEQNWAVEVNSSDDDDDEVNNGTSVHSTDSVISESKVEVADFVESDDDEHKEENQKSLRSSKFEAEIALPPPQPDIDPESGKMIFKTVLKSPEVMAKERAERAAQLKLEAEEKAKLAAIRAADNLEKQCELTDIENSALIAAFHECYTSKAVEQSSGIDRKTFRKLVREIIKHQPPSLNLGNNKIVRADPSLLSDLKDKALDDLFELAN
jgi:hypothetical protein